MITILNEISLYSYGIFFCLTIKELGVLVDKQMVVMILETSIIYFLSLLGKDYKPYNAALNFS